MRIPIRSARYTLPATLALWLVSPAAPQEGYTENGLASWYGNPYHGQSSASGEIYDMEGFTAAHPTLPFNTLVRVVNVANDKSVQVRIITAAPISMAALSISRGPPPGASGLWRRAPRGCGWK